MLIKCAHCGKETDKSAGHVNRAHKTGKNLYCSRACSSLAKRKWESKEAKVAKKSAYDAEYRVKNGATLKAKKAAQYKENPNREREKAYREANMQRHVEYCRRPEYREKKKSYDRKYRAEKHYGDLAECFLLVMEIRDECLSLMSDYEIRMAKGTMNKALQRRRDYERLDGEEPEIGALGNLERGERR